MVTVEDRCQLALATEMINNVIERHRGEDLRVLSLLTAALQDIRVGARYLTGTALSQPAPAAGVSGA